jgi:hypothetical protein
MAKRPDVTKLYDNIFTIKELLVEIVNTALETANDAESFGGEVARIVTSQLRQDFVPIMQKYIDEESNPASMLSLVKFLDSVPLAWVRTGPEQEPGMTTGSDIFAPSAPAAPAANPTMPTEDLRQQESSDPLKKMMRERWEEEHDEDFDDEERALDFEKIAGEYDGSSYEKGVLPEQFQDEIEDELYASYKEASERDPKKEALKEDILAGPYRIPEPGEVNGMADWRSIVEDNEPSTGDTADRIAEKISQGQLSL